MSDREQMFKNKALWAEHHKDAQAEIGMKNGMTEEQADAIAWLCTVRHEMHTHKDRMFVSASQECPRFTNWIDSEINEKLSDAGLDEIEFSHSIEDFYDDNYTMYLSNDDLVDMFGDEYNPEATDMMDGSSHSLLLSETLRMMEDINTDIETYLKVIDNKYGTEYSPSGIKRFF